jgi:hypothetical protein
VVIRGIQWVDKLRGADVEHAEQELERTMV